MSGCLISDTNCSRAEVLQQQMFYRQKSFGLQPDIFCMLAYRLRQFFKWTIKPKFVCLNKIYFKKLSGTRGPLDFVHSAHLLLLCWLPILSGRNLTTGKNV